MAVRSERDSGFTLDSKIPTKLPNPTTEKRLLSYMDSYYNMLMYEVRWAVRNGRPLNFDQKVISIRAKKKRGTLDCYVEDQSDPAFDLIIEVLDYDSVTATIACCVGHPDLWRIDQGHKIEFSRCRSSYLGNKTFRGLPKGYNFRTGKYSIPFPLAKQLNPALEELHARLEQVKSEYEASKAK